jgi:sugar phosphate isomerase/epimerase
MFAASSSRGAATNIRLGFDTYSLRAFKWNALQFIEYAAAQKLDAIQFSSLSDFESLETPYLSKVKEAGSKAGLQLDGGVGCVCPSARAWKDNNGTPTEYLMKGLRVSKAIGATAMRCYMGDSGDRLGTVSIDQHIENTVKALKTVRALALDVGVKIGVENHSGDMQACELKALIEEAGKDYVGACLDTGNPMWVMEDPLLTLEVLGPYTVTTHIRDSVVFEHPRGAAAQWVTLGDGIVDFKKFVARYRQLCPNAAMQLENITGRPPRVLPYLEQDFWKAFPKANASEFARFVALAKRGGPLMTGMIVADVPGPHPAEYDAALRAQQKFDLEKGFEYARKTLDVGIRWRS